MNALHIERVSARLYYGRSTPGQVVLVNGRVEFHGKGWDAIKFERGLIERQQKNKELRKKNKELRI